MPFEFPLPEEGLNRHLEFAGPGDGVFHADIDEETGKIMLWCDAPGEPPAPGLVAAAISIRIVDGVLVVAPLL